jgi:hypothetical protein
MKSRILLPTACAFAALLAACDGGAESGADAAAQDTTAEFTAAADALTAKLQAGMPDATDPAVKAFDTQVAKAMQTLGTPALPLDGFDSYDALCGKTAAIVQGYVGAGGAADAEQLARNVEAHFDQLFAPLLFSAHCSAAHMPFIEQETKDDVAGKAEGLRQVREGVYGQVGGLVQMASDPTLEDERRTRIVDLLAADAKDFAIVLSAAQRQELASAVDSLQLAETDAAKADAIEPALTGAPCGELCKM